MSTAATVLNTMQSAQQALSVMYTVMSLTGYQYPLTCTPTNLSSYDFIVIGAGTAGSVVASRLSENSNTSVLVIEAGGEPPLEATMPLAFPLMSRSAHDWNFSTVNDNYTAQNLQGSCVSMTQGKLLGGSSSVDHMIHVLPTVLDLNEWAEITGDDSLNYTNMLPYLLKMEKLNDQDILNSTYASNHGISGNLNIAKQPSMSNTYILKAYEELGHEIVLDLSPDKPLGALEPLLNIADGERQNNALAYLGPAKDRDNLCLALKTTAIKIIINSNNTATGVEIVNSAGETLIVHANKEIIVSAGAINSPAILMRSGIGPKEQLTDLNIDVIVDLPVGQNLQDHCTSPMVFQMKANSDTTPGSNPHEFPTPMTTVYIPLNNTDNNPYCQYINLMFPHDSTAQMQLCMEVFKFNEDICESLYEASSGREMLFSVPNLLKTKSRGKVMLTSKNYTDPPTIYTGMFSDSSDLTLMGKCLEDLSQILDTTYFKSINASMVTHGKCSDTIGADYWECMALEFSNTMWHYGGTCSMGNSSANTGVVNSQMKVNNLNGMRVVDASVMPTMPSGNIKAAITMLAEKLADLLRTAWNIA